GPVTRTGARRVSSAPATKGSWARGAGPVSTDQRQAMVDHIMKSTWRRRTNPTVRVVGCSTIPPVGMAARGCAARSSPGAPPGCPWDAVRPAGAITVGTHDHGPVNTGTAGPWGVLTVRNEGPGRDVVAGRWAT